MPSDAEKKTSAAGSQPVGGSLVGQILGNRGFVACVILLGACAVGFQILAEGKRIQFVKQRVELRKPLSDLDHDALRPYRLLQAQRIEPAVLDSLGTDMYLQWLMEDTTVQDESAPERLVHLFVTYYTGNPDPVPHVPEECYLGSGYRTTREQILEIPLPELGSGVVAPVKVLTFEKSALLSSEGRVVMYTFHTNGRFCADRRCVRLAIGDPDTRYAYYSKLEISFGAGGAMPPEAVAVEAGRRFLAKVIPILVKQHWPDWEAVRRSETRGGAAAGDGRPPADS